MEMMMRTTMICLYVVLPFNYLYHYIYIYTYEHTPTSTYKYIKCPYPLVHLVVRRSAHHAFGPFSEDSIIKKRERERERERERGRRKKNKRRKKRKIHHWGEERTARCLQL